LIDSAAADSAAPKMSTESLPRWLDRSETSSSLLRYFKDMPKQHSTYLDQFARVARWHVRLKEVKSGKRHDRDTAFYEDELYAFFMNCYHLKDWIKGDPTLRAANKGRDVEDAVKNDAYMQVCGGICNGEKHFGASRDKSKPNPNVLSAHIKLDVSQGTIAIEYNIDTGGTLGTMRVFDLAQKCLEFWDHYIPSLR
jgi:hypothetical protein